MIQRTRVGLLRLAAQLPDAVSVAVTLVHDALDDFVPGLSDLIEGSGLRLLALVWEQSRTTQQSFQPPTIKMLPPVITLKYSTRATRSPVS